MYKSDYLTHDEEVHLASFELDQISMEDGLSDFTELNKYAQSLSIGEFMAPLNAIGKIQSNY